MTKKLPPTQEYTHLVHYLWERINATLRADKSGSHQHIVIDDHGNELFNEWRDK